MLVARRPLMERSRGELLADATISADQGVGAGLSGEGECVAQVLVAEDTISDGGGGVG
jgi:hypothetical protein